MMEKQCPPSNQPTQCHEARRGKCRMGGTTGTMKLSLVRAKSHGPLKRETLYGPHEDYCSETTAKRCFLDAGCCWLINERLIKHLSY
jgi:hypothetical protein